MIIMKNTKRMKKLLKTTTRGLLALLLCIQLSFLGAFPETKAAVNYNNSVVDPNVTFALVTDYWGWGVEIFNKPDFMSEAIDTAYPGDYYRILQVYSNGWARISYGGGNAYLYMGGDVKQVGISELVERDSKRSAIVNYALQFVGNAYVWGGTDPNTGADCSGYIQYVYKHAAGVKLDRTTRQQVYNGKMIHALEMRPGDLMFYGESLSTIHHVTMYIGNGQVVHASDSKSGIKISPWNYRDDWLCVVDVLGDD